MKYAAHLVKNSSIDKLWRGLRRLSGDIEGVRFALVGTFQAGRYEAAEVPGDLMQKLLRVPSVKIEAMARVTKENILDEIRNPVASDGKDEDPEALAAPTPTPDERPGVGGASRRKGR